MKESVIKHKTEIYIQAFENLPDMPISATWNDSLMLKLSQSETKPSADFPLAGFKVAAVLFIFINIGYFVTAYTTTNNNAVDRNTDMKIISNELFINPSSLTN